MMRAVRYWGKEDVRLEEIPPPTCAEHQVLVAPAYSGICGTDLHEYLHGPNVHPKEPHPLTGEKCPIVLGHEFSGVVAQVGSKVTRLKVGDKVTVETTLSCGVCEPCRNGFDHVCVMAGSLGQVGGGGGISDLVAVNEKSCFVLPDHIGLDIGALVEPLAVAEHAISRTDLRPHHSVLVIGAGTIGLAVILLLKARGVKNIIVSELSSTRKALAAQFGAHHVLDPRSEDVEAISRQVTDNAGPHVVFECAGTRSSGKLASQAIRIHGTIVTVALYEGDVPFDLNALLNKEVTLKGSLSHSPTDYQNVLDKLARRDVEVAPLITKRIAIDKVVEDGFQLLQQSPEYLVKVLVEVNPQGDLERVKHLVHS